MTDPKLSTSVIYTAGELYKGEVVTCKNLLGKYVHEIAGGADRPIALCHDGNFFCDNAEELPSIGVRVSKLAVSRTTLTAITEDGLLYSWGYGIYGELGLGACNTDISYPTKVDHSANFVAISSGESHSVALDGVGNVYAWGQNFDRQLGIYTKEVSQMRKPNCLIQDMSFAPRVLPFTLKVPAAKISCGSKFTAVLSKAGEVWTWGAGDCGQLGTGRCTRKEVPSRVAFPPKRENSKQLSDVRIADLTCGSSHILALSESNELYGWGLNKRGQLGLGDTDTRQHPALINGITAKKIFAEGNSSAAIDDSGTVYTWGSGTAFRLMQSDDSHRMTPTVVSVLQGNAVHSFAFAKSSSSAALVLTRLFQVTPTSGPQKGFGEIRISGCGFWESGSIVVKFKSTNVESFIPPRSVPGRLIAPGVISCKPPKLAETGEFDVTVAVDGEVFVKEALKLNIYKAFTVAAVSPNLIDGRDGAKMAVTLTLGGMVNVKNDNQSTVLVKFLVESMHSSAPSDSENGHHENQAEQQCPETTTVTEDRSEIILVEGILVPEEDEAAGGGGGGGPSSSHHDDHDHHDDGGGGGDEPVESTTRGGARGARRAPDRYVTCEIPASAVPVGKLFAIRAQVSLNEWDYSAYSPHGVGTIICHTFEPFSATPSCVPCNPPVPPRRPEMMMKHTSDGNVDGSGAVVEREEEGQGAEEVDVEEEEELPQQLFSPPEEICIRGESLFPEGKLASSMTVEATFTAVASHVEGGRLWPVEFNIPVRCATATMMYLMPPTLNEVIAQMPPPTPRPEPEVKFEPPVVDTPPTPVEVVVAVAAAVQPAKKAAAAAGRAASQAAMQSQQPLAAIPTKVEQVVEPVPPPPPPEIHTLNQVRGHLKFYLLVTGNSGNVIKTLLSPTEVPLDLYFPQPLDLDPPVLARKTGGAVVSIRGKSWSGYRFTSATARVVLRRTGSDTEVSIAREHITFTAIDRSRDSVASAPVPTAHAGGVSSELQDHDHDFGSVQEGDHEVVTNGRGGNAATTDEAVLDPEYKLSFVLPDVSSVFTLSDASGAAAAAAAVQHEEGDEEGSQGHSPVDHSGETVSHLTVSLLMDGVTAPPASHIAAIVLFESLHIESVNAAPKGGFTSGSSVTVVVSGLPQSPFLTGVRACIVRIKGLDHHPDDDEGGGGGKKGGKKGGASTGRPHSNVAAVAADDSEHATHSAEEVEAEEQHRQQPPSIDVTGSLKIDSNEISFVIPEADQIAKLHPILNKKDKTYFFAVSLDGGNTFDVSESPILIIK